MIQLFITAFIEIRLLDIIDILLVAILLFELYNLLKGTVAINIFIGILAIFLLWQLVSAFQMELLSKILGAFFSVGFIALIVIFQPEIRRFLLALGTPALIRKKNKRFLFWRFSINNGDQPDIDTIIVACQRMADAHTGALIVITRQNELKPYVDTGEVLDAKISVALLENLFYRNSPLHDGAVIITGNQIRAAGCVLPVSNNTELPKRLGLRHRAGVGITEYSDALSIIVSEQTGRIALANRGHITLRVAPAQIKDFLESELNMENSSKSKQSETTQTS
ncbi:MAG: diadenylate cyclase CdaA [Bacteroidetes bacterium]|nr:diadenylate cyclase CdaA [Bacteroidota bacterium]